MTREALMELLSGIEMMGGDPLSEVLAPSEIRAIIETLAQAGLVADGLPDNAPTGLGLELLAPDAFVFGGTIIPQAVVDQPLL